MLLLSIIGTMPSGGLMATVVIFGAGVMGSATAFPLTDNGHDVRLVGTHLDDEIIDSVRTRGYHPTLKRRLPERATAFRYTELADALRGADFILSGVNSYGVRWAAETLAPALTAPLPVIAITKGLDCTEQGDIVALTTVYEEALEAAGAPHCDVSGVGGPCIAGELAGRRQSCVVFASSTREQADWFAAHFRTPYYHVWTTADLLGLEVAAALKNAYTLPVAIASGFLEREGEADEANAQMHNLEAAVFGQGVAEIRYLLQVCGQPSLFAASLPGAGDYYVTCAGGRNMRFGRLLGSGRSLAQALDEMQGITIESLSIIAAMARALPRLAARGVIDRTRVPLLDHLICTVEDGRAEPFPLDAFFGDLC